MSGVNVAKKWEAAEWTECSSQATYHKGCGLLAGRNNKENDILTHKMAAQNDIWLHAHGYPGSHVILCRDGEKEEPSKQSIEDAAGVAAFGAKGSLPKVSVVYTLAKYGHKPKGGAVRDYEEKKQLSSSPMRCRFPKCHIKNNM